jgi:hypothetical protein
MFSPFFSTHYMYRPHHLPWFFYPNICWRVSLWSFFIWSSALPPLLPNFSQFQYHPQLRVFKRPQSMYFKNKCTLFQNLCTSLMILSRLCWNSRFEGERRSCNYVRVMFICAQSRYSDILPYLLQWKEFFWVLAWSILKQGRKFADQIPSRPSLSGFFSIYVN